MNLQLMKCPSRFDKLSYKRENNDNIIDVALSVFVTEGLKAIFLIAIATMKT